MMRTKKLCAIMLDTLGREMMVRRPCEIGEDGWPSHPNPIEISAGQTITLTTREDAESTADVFPLTYPHFHSMVQVGDTIYIGRCAELADIQQILIDSRRQCRVVSCSQQCQHLYRGMHLYSYPQQSNGLHLGEAGVVLHAQ